MTRVSSLPLPLCDAQGQQNRAHAGGEALLLGHQPTNMPSDPSAFGLLVNRPLSSSSRSKAAPDTGVPGSRTLDLPEALVGNEDTTARARPFNADGLLASVMPADEARGAGHGGSTILALVTASAIQGSSTTALGDSPVVDRIAGHCGPGVAALRETLGSGPIARQSAGPAARLVPSRVASPSAPRPALTAPNIGHRAEDPVSQTARRAAPAAAARLPEPARFSPIQIALCATEAGLMLAARVERLDARDERRFLEGVAELALTAGVPLAGIRINGRNASPRLEREQGSS